MTTVQAVAVDQLAKQSEWEEVLLAGTQATGQEAVAAVGSLAEQSKREQEQRTTLQIAAVAQPVSSALL